MRYAINYDDAVQLTREAAPDVHRVLLENAPKGKPGPKGKNGNELTASTPLILDRNHHNKSVGVLYVRLAQERLKY